MFWTLACVNWRGSQGLQMGIYSKWIVISSVKPRNQGRLKVGPPVAVTICLFSQCKRHTHLTHNSMNTVPSTLV